MKIYIVVVQRSIGVMKEIIKGCVFIIRYQQL